MYTYHDHTLIEPGGLVLLALDEAEVIRLLEHVPNSLKLHQRPLLGYHCIACLMADMYLMSCFAHDA